MLVFVLSSNGILSYAALMGIPNPGKTRNGLGDGKILTPSAAESFSTGLTSMLTIFSFDEIRFTAEFLARKSP